MMIRTYFAVLLIAAVPDLGACGDALPTRLPDLFFARCDTPTIITLRYRVRTVDLPDEVSDRALTLVCDGSGTGPMYKDGPVPGCVAYQKTTVGLPPPPPVLCGPAGVGIRPFGERQRCLAPGLRGCITSAKPMEGFMVICDDDRVARAESCPESFFIDDNATTDVSDDAVWCGLPPGGRRCDRLQLGAAWQYRGWLPPADQDETESDAPADADADREAPAPAVEEPTVRYVQREVFADMPAAFRTRPGPRPPQGPVKATTEGVKRYECYTERRGDVEHRFLLSRRYENEAPYVVDPADAACLNVPPESLCGRAEPVPRRPDGTPVDYLGTGGAPRAGLCGVVGAETQLVGPGDGCRVPGVSVCLGNNRLLCDPGANRWVAYDCRDALRIDATDGPRYACGPERAPCDRVSAEFAARARPSAP